MQKRREIIDCGQGRIPASMSYEPQRTLQAFITVYTVSDM